MDEKRLAPAFENCDKCIVLASDNSFIPCAAVMIESILEKAQAENKYDIIILHKNITDLNQMVVCNMASGKKNVSIRFYNVAQIVAGRNLFVKNRPEITEETFYRLVIPWILDEAYHWALYMDGDMVVAEDLFSIFDFVPERELVSAVRDYWGICACYKPESSLRVYRESLDLADIDNYFIAATLILNLDKFRQNYQMEDILEIATSREWRQHDQDVLNSLCKNDVKYLSPTWGFMDDYGDNHYLPVNLREELEKVEQDPHVIHYGGARKPWIAKHIKRGMRFWQYAQNTPYFAALLEKVKNFEYRNYIAYSLADGDVSQIDQKYTERGIERSYRGAGLGNIASGHTRYRVIEIRNGKLHLEGMVGFFAVRPESEVKIFLDVNGNRFPVDSQSREDGFIQPEMIKTYRGESFKFDLSLGSDIDKYTIKIVCEINGLVVEKNNLGFEKFSSLGRVYKSGYYYSEQWAVWTDRRFIFVSRCGEDERKQFEKKFIRELRQSRKPSDKKAIIARTIVRNICKFIKKPIWLVADRLSTAGDNGEAFFKYLNQKAKSEVSAYFIIDKKAEDYKRLKQYGKVIPAYSWRHKLLQLMADFVISSQTDEIFRNPFQKFSEPYRDMLSKVRYVFLQHGIIMNDLSGWLCRKNQHMAGFVTSAWKEKQSILDGNYDYDKEVWLTGQPRFDLLEDKKERYITIMPTWRRWLAIGQDQETGVWRLKKNFAESEYARFYRGLMHNQRLQAKAAELGYQLQFKIHPSFYREENSFGFEPYVSIVDASVSYQEIYAKSSLIITDYSSSSHDFAYLRKPIIYCQFDADEFFAGSHIVSGRGYFDYARDGFGEVEYDLESTVDRIIEYMENGCQLKEKYRERIDQFFAFNDKNNCQRVYEKIMELEGKA